MGRKEDKLKINKNGNSSINIGSKNKFEGDTVIGHDIKIVKNVVDNSVEYEVDVEDVTVLQKISPYLIERYGKKKIGFIGIISLISGLIGIFTWINSITPNIKLIPYLPIVPNTYSKWFLYLIIFLLAFGIILLAIIQYHTSTKCKKCNKEYAYEEVGTPTVREVETLDGIRRVTTRSYECKFCGDIDVRRNKELIEKSG